MADSLTVHFVQPEFNGGAFSAGDITSRMAKPKHMGMCVAGCSLRAPFRPFRFPTHAALSPAVAGAGDPVCLQLPAAWSTPMPAHVPVHLSVL